jgi:aldose 1-epimerase
VRWLAIFGRNCAANILVIFVMRTLGVAGVQAGENPVRVEVARSPENAPVEIVTISNKRGLRARLLTWGATLTSLEAPDRNGAMGEVTLGFDDPADYLAPHPFFGCVAGRFANRIAKGQFSLDGRTYTLAVNNGQNHLHGGERGFDKRNWSIVDAKHDEVTFEYWSADGEEGYPGGLTTRVVYRLTARDELEIQFEARCDAPTVLNLVNHAYWNLSGESDVLDHELVLNASRYTVVDRGSIPTGELRAVDGTPMDFRAAKQIRRDIAGLADAPGGGYDHNWVLDGGEPGRLRVAAELYSAKSGRSMTVLTDQPGIQFYTGNYLAGPKGRGGKPYSKYGGLCLETQRFPDSPNQPSFPSTVLRPGALFRSVTIHRFGTR